MSIWTTWKPHTYVHGAKLVVVFYGWDVHYICVHVDSKQRCCVILVNMYMYMFSVHMDNVQTTICPCLHCILLRQYVHYILQRQLVYMYTKTTCVYCILQRPNVYMITCVQRQHVYIKYE